MARLKIKQFMAVLLITGMGATSCEVNKKSTVGTANTNVSSGVKDYDAGFEKDILYYVNQHRKSIGLGELRMIAAANEQAYKHSKDMAAKATGFGHEGFTERIDAIRRKIGFIPASAENVAYGYLNAKAVVAGWLNSPPHKKNMEGNYTLTGIGIAIDKKGVTYFTQIFIKQ